MTFSQGETSPPSSHMGRMSSSRLSFNRIHEIDGYSDSSCGGSSASLDAVPLHLGEAGSGTEQPNRVRLNSTNAPPKLTGGWGHFDRMEVDLAGGPPREVRV